MAVEPSVPDYKRDLIRDFNELKKEIKWAIENPSKISKEKIKDFQRGIKNLEYIAEDKIKDVNFLRDLHRFHILITNIPNKLSDIDKERVNLIFERLENLINDLG
ncbi:MAG: hypothetical protein JXA94_07300 [Parachlamydiales bacterium]|nr:hypothetical protein [Parachlamydiales bacterium]